MTGGGDTMHTYSAPLSPSGRAGPPTGAAAGSSPDLAASYSIRRFGTGELLSDAIERASRPISVRYIGDEWWLIWRLPKGWTCSSHPSAASARRAYLRVIDFFFPASTPETSPDADTARAAP